jgi:hypothetical protein
VTGYFDLGDFKKHGHPFRTKKMYLEWMTGFKNILNPVVAFFDTKEVYKHFRKIRADLPANHTKQFLIKRGDLWSFSKYILDEQGKIFGSSRYPHYSPRTVIPAYASAMHAKYELTKKAVEMNYFNTTHIVWVDVGFWRDLYNESKKYRMALPYDFDDERIAFNQVYERHQKTTPTRIILDDSLWIAGGLFVARNDVMLHWFEVYKKYTELFLSLGLMNSDEQSIYAMFADAMLEQPDALLQVYPCISRHNRWFSLGYAMREIGMFLW